jgi:ribosomal-protein-alanine N-acetyltransferase
VVSGVSGVRIEPMQVADLPEVVAIERAAFGEKNRDEKHFLEEMGRPWSRLWVVREQGSAVRGFLLSWVVTDELQILDVAVDPQARRRGLGLALMHHALADARVSEIRLVLLEVRASNLPALTLYERLGFERTRVRRSYYPDGEDGIEMLLQL